MPKWQKDQKEFIVSISYGKRRGIQAYIPKPIIEMLGNPKNMKFLIKGKKIEIEGA
ncbi:MAG: hypothetical protein WAM14_05995 [Candidatus Nitrosopolaris sp.]